MAGSKGHGVRAGSKGLWPWWKAGYNGSLGFSVPLVRQWDLRQKCYRLKVVPFLLWSSSVSEGEQEGVREAV